MVIQSALLLTGVLAVLTLVRHTVVVHLNPELTTLVYVLLVGRHVFLVLETLTADGADEKAFAYNTDSWRFYYHHQKTVW